MINLRDGKITDLINNTMAYNPETMSIGYAILQEKQRLMALADHTRLMAVVENLDEWVLDYLAVELRAPAYEDSFSIEVKRALIAGTLSFYAKLGTPMAINWATRTIFGESQLIEWFDYGSKPYHFKMRINITDDVLNPAKDRQVINAINVCKNLRSHLDSIEYFIKVPPTLAYSGAIAASSSQQVSVDLQPDVHWPQTAVAAQAGVLPLVTAGGYSVALPVPEAHWPQSKLTPRFGVAVLEVYQKITV